MKRKRLSGNHLLDFVGADEKTPVWIGLDVHKKNYHVALARRLAVILWRLSVENRAYVIR